MPKAGRIAAPRGFEHACQGSLRSVAPVVHVQERGKLFGRGSPLRSSGGIAGGHARRVARWRRFGHRRRDRRAFRFGRLVTRAFRRSVSAGGRLCGGCGQGRHRRSAGRRHRRRFTGWCPTCRRPGCGHGRGGAGLCVAGKGVPAQTLLARLVQLGAVEQPAVDAGRPRRGSDHGRGHKWRGREKALRPWAAGQPAPCVLRPFHHRFHFSRHTTSNGHTCAMRSRSR
ncbi:hypothetical protein M2351_007067 [Azospirillum canadense]|nr:hypothetical protein [Azospirillum canadense]